jgi:hypothetical protein
LGIAGKFGENMLVDRIPRKKIAREEKPFILER